MDQYRNSSYRFRLEISLSIVLVLAILVFYLYPRFSELITSQNTYTPVIEIIHIPPTNQRLSKRPPPPRPKIPVVDEEIEILNPVIITLDQTKSIYDTPPGSDFQSGLPEGYRPRQLLEVVPKKAPGNISGEIVLALKIGKNGKVSEHRLLRNSTESTLCLEHAIQAATASLWESALVNDKPVEYWIEKTYKFNID